MSIKYSKDHEWVRLEGDIATIGISAYAQEQLGDIVFVELPESGQDFGKGDEAAVVESVKAASDVYTPVSGEIVETNPALDGEPALVNQDPQGQGWFFKLTIKDASELDELMDEAAYAAYVADL